MQSRRLGRRLDCKSGGEVRCNEAVAGPSRSTTPSPGPSRRLEPRAAVHHPVTSGPSLHARARVGQGGGAVRRRAAAPGAAAGKQPPAPTLWKGSDRAEEAKTDKLIWQS